MAGYAILQKAGIDPVWKGFLPEGRVFSTIGQPNALAAYLVIALAPVCYLLRVARGTWRALPLVVLAEIVTALLFTQSRGAILGLAAMAAASACCVQDKRRLAAVTTALIVVGVTILVLVPPVHHAAGRAWDEITTRGGREGRLSIENHLDLWEIASRIALDHPLLGIGQESYPDAFPRYSHALLSAERAAYFDAFRVESAHNVYLNLAANTGVPTLVAYGALILGFVRVAARSARPRVEQAHRLALLTVVVAVAGHLATDLFMTADITSTWLFWTLIGAGLGVTCPSRPLPRPRGGLPVERRGPDLAPSILLGRSTSAGADARRPEPAQPARCYH